MTLEPLSQSLDQDKKNLLNVSDLTQAEQNLSLSALKILKERYLLKDDQGNIIERPHQLLQRVAVGVGIMEVLYDKEFYDKDNSSTNLMGMERIVYQTHLKFMLDQMQKHLDFDYKLLYNPESRMNLKIGDFSITPFHLERLFARYMELFEEGRTKVKFEDILTKLKDESFSKKYLPLIQTYYDLMESGTFLPNTPALMNCGTRLAMNAACFTLEMKDDLDHIYKTYGDIAKIFKAGGGIGINYSQLREEGAYVKGTGGKSSGTLSWLKGTDETTGRVAQGGKRRGASMGILNSDHKEIERFVDLKADNQTLVNHNISVCAPDTFFEDFFKSGNGLMTRIARNAWISGDPGMVFLDNMNKNNLLKEAMDGKPIDVTNPCSEIALYPYESCILASINLSKFINKEGKFEFFNFSNIVGTVTKFLDSMIDATKYPIDEINKMTKSCRRIGVGFMGLADALVKMGIPYNSKEGFIFAEFVSALMTMIALCQSNELADKKGAFPLWYDKRYPKGKIPVIAWNDKKMMTELKENLKNMDRYFEDTIDAFEYLTNHGEFLDLGKGFRNCSVTTVAPTGTLSMLADCSSGIEPLFSLGYTKKVTIGDFTYVDKNFEEAMKKYLGSFTYDIEKDVIKRLANSSSIADKKYIPEYIRKVFVTAMDIHPYDHLMMQAHAQRWITNGISKTINLSSSATQKMIEHSYVLSWALGNKGISVYRDGCKDTQVLNSSSSNKNIVHQKVSEYTTSVIKELNLPYAYKEQILIGSEPTSVLESEITITPTFSQETKIICTNCGTYNGLIKTGRGDQCFMCRDCGTQLGSCN